MNRKSIIGDKELFAIEYQVTEAFENFLYGKFCYWIQGMQIGEYDEGTTLSDMLWRIPYLVKDNGNREHKKLFELELKEVFNVLNSTLFGEGNPQYSDISEKEMWARFDICMNVDIFYNYKTFLVEFEDIARIIFSDKDGVLHQIYIKKGIVDDVFQKLSIEFNNIYDEFINNK